MRVYLAGGVTTGNITTDKVEGVLQKLKSAGYSLNVLESFFDIRKRRAMTMLKYVDNFILDSGAFSFIQSGRQTDWNEYVTKYIDFIREYNVQLYFELDIDKLIGYERVKEIRRRLERETGKRPIPVWHKRLGKEEFLKMCDEYDYVAIGGIVSKEIVKDEYKYFPAFIREAHKRGAKIHGLGFTDCKYLRYCHFDSVDSSSWTIGNRYGRIAHFDGKKMSQTSRPPNTRIVSLPLAIHNFTEWVKFSNYAERNL